MGGPERRHVSSGSITNGRGRVREGEGQPPRLAQTRGSQALHGGGGVQTRWIYTLVTAKGKTAQTLKACPLESDGVGEATSQCCGLGLLSPSETWSSVQSGQQLSLLQRT